jgi:nucleotide-binding universal stress UspA family protein
VIVIRRILFPIDFSGHTYTTAPFVDAMASRFSARLVLLSVVPILSRPSRESGQADLIDPEPLKQDLEPRLDGVLRKEFAHLEVERVVELGDPAEVIARFADTQGVDLTMMPTRGQGPFRRLLLGSVTAKVVHDAQCPVWTNVHTDQPLPLDAPVAQTVVCALDGTPESSPVMDWAARFAGRVGAKLRFVHVIPGLEESSLRFPKPKLEGLQQEAFGRIENLQRTAGVKAPTSVVIGKIGRRFCDEARNHQADLVVIGRGKLHDSAGRLGRNAYDIIRHAPCPVISV